jgi:hypothetical protein
VKADLERAQTKHGLRRFDLALLLGVSPRQLRGIERESEPLPPGFLSRLQQVLDAPDLSKLKFEKTGSITWPWTGIVRNLALGILGAALYWTGKAIRTDAAYAFGLQVIGGAMILIFAVRGRKIAPQCSRCGSKVQAGQVICTRCSASFVPTLSVPDSE